MSVHLSFETISELVDQLPPEQQEILMRRLLERAKNRQLSSEERKALYHASILNVPFNEEPSPRREDWYDDEGR